jgi:hypothetical protein
MGINTKWDDAKQTRVLVEFESSWTWAELDNALEATDKLILSVSHTVDIIIDLEGTSIPKDFMAAAKKILANPERRDNEGNRVVIGASDFMRSAYQTLKGAFGSKLVGREVLFANDLSHARSMLFSMRSN